MAWSDDIEPTLGMVPSVMSWGKIRSKTINKGIWCELSPIGNIPKIVQWGRNGETIREKGAVCTLVVDHVKRLKNTIFTIPV